MSGKGLLSSIAAGCAGVILASLFVPGFEVVGEFTQSIKILLLAGIVLGLINFFIKPLLYLITLPLRWLTFGLFSLVINLGLVWTVDIIFTPEITLIGFRALFLTTLIVWLANLLAPGKRKKRKRRKPKQEPIKRPYYYA